MIGFLHTSPIHLASFKQLAKTKLPDQKIIQLVDESLLEQAQNSGLSKTLEQKVMTRLIELKNQQVNIIVCTCSSIGTIVEASAIDNCITLRVDRPMADQAVHYSNILIIAALQSTLEASVQLLTDSAEKQGLQPNIDIKLVEGAWDYFKQNHQTQYQERIAQFIRAHADNYDAVVLAQASMAPAIELCKTLKKPILASPEIAIEYLKKFV